MDSPGTSSQASTPRSNRRLIQSDEVVFRYRWPVRVSQRVINAETGDTIILNISQPFCTSYSGVLFTWTLRLHDDYAVNETGGYDGNGTQVNVSLYYKDGPGVDVCLKGVTISVADSEDRPVFSNLKIGGEEWTKGSGWPVKHSEAAGQVFSNFIRQNVGKTVYITADLRMSTSDFDPLNYLPSLDSPSATLQLICEQLVNEVVDKTLRIPEVDLMDPSTDHFAIHRKIFLFSCGEITKRFNETSYSGKLHPKTIQNVLSHIYFKKLMEPSISCIEDLIQLLEGIHEVHLPALKREVERFICNKVLLEDEEPGLQYVKQALLLATRYDLVVVRMMASGIILDRFNIEDNMNYIREELAQVAVQLPFRSIPSMSDDDESSADEMLIGSVLDSLQTLSRRMRRVSMSPSNSGSTPTTPLTLNPLSKASQNSVSSSSTSSSERSTVTVTIKPTSSSSIKIGRFRSEILVDSPNSSSSSSPDSSAETSPSVTAAPPAPFKRRMQRIMFADCSQEAVVPTSNEILDAVFTEENLLLPSDDQITIGRNGTAPGLAKISP
ncbi:hypothetical protein L596_007081 [Steinernema carpocapsae]|uniref:BTB domain-containing protein n=1 Tax=Steinernema carpocapsae TaxID=34508 RepID=A0A4U5P873_STECR|nr:hypothetical protein L596_007081 [Steinernema carpocapsae]